MRRELSDAALHDQLDAVIAHAARNTGASLDHWMDSKDFAGPDRRALRRLLGRRNR